MADMTKGKHANIELITGDPKKAINKLAWPMMLSMLLIMLYNLADSVWVSGLGADALAALGFITPLFMIIIGLGNGIGAGANSLIARAFGAKKDELANNAALHSVVLTVIIGIVIPIILLPLIPEIVVIMGGASVTELCMDYSKVTFGLLIVFLFVHTEIKIKAKKFFPSCLPFITSGIKRKFDRFLILCMIQLLAAGFRNGAASF